MNLLIVGVNHTTAPTALREKIAFSPDQLGDALLDLQRHAELDELAILSTCNRTEIYAVTQEANAGEIVGWLSDYHRQPPDELAGAIYTHWAEGATRHLMRVASGLDSMVLGEPQILGQLKDCFRAAERFRVLGKHLDRIAQNTYRVAKLVRTDTGIGENPVSVASTAVDLAAQLFTDLASCNALLVGAGETIELVGRHLQSAGLNHFVVVNRTVRNAEVLASELEGSAGSLAELADRLEAADIVVASTASQLPIIGKGMVERALKTRRHRPIFMVDLAVPRDIEPEVNELRDAYLYGMDDLQQSIEANLSIRSEAAQEAEVMIERAAEEFKAAGLSLAAVDTVVKFRGAHERLKQAELDKALKRLENGEDPGKVLTSFANQLTNKMIHTPSVQLKQAKIEGRDDLLEAIRHLFQLDD